MLIDAEVPESTGGTDAFSEPTPGVALWLCKELASNSLLTAAMACNSGVVEGLAKLVKSSRHTTASRSMAARVLTQLMAGVGPADYTGKAPVAVLGALEQHLSQALASARPSEVWRYPLAQLCLESLVLAREIKQTATVRHDGCVCVCCVWDSYQ
jgi:hypothetical protein